jgi:hypothetical protein
LLHRAIGLLRSREIARLQSPTQLGQQLADRAFSPTMMMVMGLPELARLCGLVLEVLLNGGKILLGGRRVSRL